nr:MAG TPA: hypothetical protein [Caudoviricetes sp.]
MRKNCCFWGVFSALRSGSASGRAASKRRPAMELYRAQQQVRESRGRRFARPEHTPPP